MVTGTSAAAPCSIQESIGVPPACSAKDLGYCLVGVQTRLQTLRTAPPVSYVPPLSRMLPHRAVCRLLRPPVPLSCPCSVTALRFMASDGRVRLALLHAARDEHWGAGGGGCGSRRAVQAGPVAASPLLPAATSRSSSTAAPRPTCAAASPTPTASPPSSTSWPTSSCVSSSGSSPASPASATSSSSACAPSWPRRTASTPWPSSPCAVSWERWGGHGGALQLTPPQHSAARARCCPPFFL